MELVSALASLDVHELTHGCDGKRKKGEMLWRGVCLPLDALRRGGRKARRRRRRLGALLDHWHKAYRLEQVDCVLDILSARSQFKHVNVSM